MKSFRFCFLLALTLTSAVRLSAVEVAAPATTALDSDRWEARVERYLEKDKANPPPIGGIVFTGSSSIDMWLSLAKDFPDLPVVRRGIGGTRLTDLPHFAAELVYPLNPRIIVVYAGENDLQAGGTVDAVVSAFEIVRERFHAAVPNAPIVYLAIKPSPSRSGLLPAMREANTRIAALCAKDPQCTFVDVFSPMLDAQGEVRPELFSEDRLHINADGYRLWTELVKPVLARLEQRPR